jgi:hypothetical protein
LATRVRWQQFYCIFSIDSIFFDCGANLGNEGKVAAILLHFFDCGANPWQRGEGGGNLIVSCIFWSKLPHTNWLKPDRNNRINRKNRNNRINFWYSPKPNQRTTIESIESIESIEAFPQHPADPSAA